MNTKPCMSSHNKRIIVLIYTKNCSDTEGYKNQTNFSSEVLSAQCINRRLISLLKVAKVISPFTGAAEVAHNK